MPSQPDIVQLALIFLVIANLIGIPAYALNVRLGARRDKRNAAAIAKAIVDYFRRSGVAVSVDCSRVSRRGGFTAAIESEPMKRFRLSHIIEATLREHVRKTCGQELEKVFWRFPIGEKTQEAAAGEAMPAEHSDEYINEGLEHYRHIPKPEVEELRWEDFEQMTTIGREPKAADPQAQQHH
jgi:hypothetical protein